jgi:hypothetical protein
LPCSISDISESIPNIFGITGDEECCQLLYAILKEVVRVTASKLSTSATAAPLSEGISDLILFGVGITIAHSPKKFKEDGAFVS